MVQPGLERTIVDPAAYTRTLRRFRELHIILPTFAQLADPTTLPPELHSALATVPADAPHPLNLFRVHWYNDADGGIRELPEHLSLPESLTGVAARILVATGRRFPMIHAHKVLAAYAVLAPQLVTGQFDPQERRAIWPSLGNYGRGGVAISRLLGCRGATVLRTDAPPDRLRWLSDWVSDPDDILRLSGSSPRAVHDRCAELGGDQRNVVFNQYREFGNYLAHYLCTGQALARLFEIERAAHPMLRLRAFVAATGSAGTLGAGDYLKERYGARIAALEPAESPTLLYNGIGTHHIPGIGDGHIPFIHNVMNTDVVAAVSDVSTDRLLVMLNHPAGQRYLIERRQVPAELVAQLSALGPSGIANVLGAIKLARYYRLGPEDAIVTVSTDSAQMYSGELPRILGRDFPGGFDAVSAAETFGQHVLGAAADWLQELSERDRERIFNLGYFTWVEQRGVSVEAFAARRDPGFWRGLRGLIPTWDELIDEFNARVRVGPKPAPAS